MERDNTEDFFLYCFDFRTLQTYCLFNIFSIINASICCCNSAAKGCPTLRPHGLQYAGLPCPALSPLSPGVCSSILPINSSRGIQYKDEDNVIWGFILESTDICDA